MEINEYLSIYKVPIGTKVVIKECHSRPEIVGRSGKVEGWVNVEDFTYPLMVYLDEPIYIPIPGAGVAVPFQGPHFCRPDELEVVGTGDVPDVFKQGFDEPDKGQEGG